MFLEMKDWRALHRYTDRVLSFLKPTLITGCGDQVGIVDAEQCWPNSTERNDTKQKCWQTTKKGLGGYPKHSSKLYCTRKGGTLAIFFQGLFENTCTKTTYFNILSRTLVCMKKTSQTPMLLVFSFLWGSFRWFWVIFCLPLLRQSCRLQGCTVSGNCRLVLKSCQRKCSS